MRDVSSLDACVRTVPTKPTQNDYVDGLMNDQSEVMSKEILDRWKELTQQMGLPQVPTYTHYYFSFSMPSKTRMVDGIMRIKASAPPISAIKDYMMDKLRQDPIDVVILGCTDIAGSEFNYLKTKVGIIIEGMETDNAE